MKFKAILRPILRYFIKAFSYCGSIHRASANAFSKALFSLIRWVSNSRIDIRIMALPLVWMDELECNKKGLLSRGVKGITYGPHYIGRVQSTENIYRSDINYYVFERARVSVISSSVILNDKRVIIDRALSQDQDKYNYAGGHILAHDGDTVIVHTGKSEDIKKGFFLGGNGSSNYYHWMVEILAKLEFLSKLPERYQKYPLLVSEDVVGTPSLKETLDLFANGCELIVLSEKMSYVVDELIFINCPSNVPFNMLGNQKAKLPDCSINNLSIDYVRKIALQNALKTAMPLNYQKKIFLGRKSGIRNYNQDEVFNYLSAFGFTKIFLEDLSFLEQVRTIYHADFIVGPTGAAWTNLIFCRSGARGLCWMADESGDFSAFSSIAGMVGVDLIYITYKSDVRSTRELYSKDYYIDLSMIENGLSVLGETFVPAL